MSRPIWRWWRCNAPMRPRAETLTSFFSSGTPPSGCAPAAGVSVAVTENEKPLSGSPFTHRHGRHPRGPRRPGFRGHGQGRPEVAAVRVRTAHPGGQRRSLRQPGAARLGHGRGRRALRQCADLRRRQAEPEARPRLTRAGPPTSRMPSRGTGRDAIRPTPTSARASHRGGRSPRHVRSPTSATSPSSPRTPGDWTPTVMALAASPVSPSGGTTVRAASPNLYHQRRLPSPRRPRQNRRRLPSLPAPSHRSYGVRSAPSQGEPWRRLVRAP